MTRKDKKGRNLRIGEYQRGDNRYEYRYTNEVTNSTESIYAQDLATLRLREKERLKEIEEGLDTSNKLRKATLNKYFEYYVDLIQVEESTRTNYKIVWNSLVKEDLGERKLVDIRHSHIRKFYSDKTKEMYSYGTLKVVQAILSPMLQMAVEDELIRKNPAYKALNGYGVKQKKREAMSVNEQESFIRFMERNRWYMKHLPMITFMLGTAVRVGELSGLTWDDVDLKNREIHIDHQLVYKNYGEGCRFYLSTPKTEAGNRIIQQCSV